MHHPPVSWHHLGGLYPFVFREVGRNINVFVVVLAAAVDGKFGNGQDDIRLDMPARDQGGRRRKILGIALLGCRF